MTNGMDDIEDDPWKGGYLKVIDEEVLSDQWSGGYLNG